MNWLVFVIVEAVVLPIVFGGFWLFDTYLPRRKRRRRESSLAYLERQAEIPLAQLIEDAENEAERQWYADWHEWRTAA